MPARVRDIAQEVADAINAGSYSLTAYTAIRTYQPVWDVPGLDRELKVAVIPSNDITWTLRGRGHYDKVHPIDAGFGRHLAEGTDAEMDTYIDFVEEVATDLRRKTLTLTDDGHTLTCQGVEFRPLFSTTQHNDANVFFSVVRFTYQVTE